jgi:putative PIN family toxin of toxin-antitoxin system
VTVVLDTNVLVAALVAEGLCREVVHRALRMRVVASSVPLLDELQSTLQRKFKVTPAVASFLDSLRQQVRLVEPHALPEPVCRDADDDAVLATAVAAGAGLIVTGDADLLVLESHAGIAIVSPRQFLAWLDQASGAEV